MDVSIWVNSVAPATEAPRWDGARQVPGSRTGSGQEPGRSRKGLWATPRPLFFTRSEMGASERSGQDWLWSTLFTGSLQLLPGGKQGASR